MSQLLQILSQDCLCPFEMFRGLPGVAVPWPSFPGHQVFVSRTISSFRDPVSADVIHFVVGLVIDYVGPWGFGTLAACCTFLGGRRSGFSVLVGACHLLLPLHRALDLLQKIGATSFSGALCKGNAIYQVPTYRLVA
jgi:hypothetical protein